LRLGVRGQTSFLVHFVMAGAVLVAAALLQLDRTQWCVLVLCITVVLVAEMFNSALEQLARAVDRSENRYLGSALDIGSAAVLMAAMGATVVGSLVFLSRVKGWI